MSSILIMVMENPIQVTIVMAVPFEAGGAFKATRPENTGESAITTNPQKNKKAISKGADVVNKKNGDNRQHKQERDKAMVAILFAPKRCDSKPLAAQASAPQAIIKKDKNEIFKLL